MKWYEWIFDGIGTTVIGAICSFIGYKAAVKKMSNQSQIAGENSKQRQEVTIENIDGTNSVLSSISQTQEAGNNAEQFQCGGFKDGR